MLGLGSKLLGAKFSMIQPFWLLKEFWGPILLGSTFFGSKKFCLQYFVKGQNFLDHYFLGQNCSVEIFLLIGEKC